MKKKVVFVIIASVMAMLLAVLLLFMPYCELLHLTHEHGDKPFSEFPIDSHCSVCQIILAIMNGYHFLLLLVGISITALLFLSYSLINGKESIMRPFSIVSVRLNI